MLFDVHLGNPIILLQSGGGTRGTVLYTVRGVRGLEIGMLTLDTTSLCAEDRGLQVPMTLEHGSIVGTQCCNITRQHCPVSRKT